MRVSSAKTYKNNKTKNLYTVLTVGKHTETGEEMVVYVRADFKDKQIWIRPVELFKEKFTETTI